MVPGNLLLLTVAVIAVASTLLSMASLAWIIRPKRAVKEGAADFLPPITILKPLKGVDEGLEENLRSFFRLDYPTVQLLFGVADQDDPAIPIVRRLLEEFPEHDARLVVGCPVFGLNPKVENLAAMNRFRKHSVLLISDSNVRARPEYLRETVCYLADPKVGLVSNLFTGVGERQSAAAIENLQLNGFIAGGVAMASMLGLTCVVGKSMLIRAEALDAIGGFSRVRNLLAEDQVMGIRIRQAGFKVRLSHHVIENVNTDRDLHWFLNRHSRWYKIRARLATPAFLIEPAGNLAGVGLIWALSGESGLAWGGLLVLVGLGIARDAIQTRWLRGTWPQARHLWLSPIKDLFLLPVWFDALVNRRVVWRGHRLIIGRFTRLRLARVPLTVRRRVRRVNRFRARGESPSV